MGSKARRVALLCAILGAHLFLFLRLSIDYGPRSARPVKPPALLLWIQLPSPADAPRAPHSPPRHLESTRDRPVKDKVIPGNAISVRPDDEVVGASVDWHAEAQRAASDTAEREREKRALRLLDQHPAGLGPLPPKPSGHKRGDSEHFAAGEIIDWVSSNCYYSNQFAPRPEMGQALRLQIPTCKGPDEAPLPTIEEWKKERDNR